MLVYYLAGRFLNFRTPRRSGMLFKILHCTNINQAQFYMQMNRTNLSTYLTKTIETNLYE